MLTRWNNFFANDLNHPFALLNDWNRQLERALRDSRETRSLHQEGYAIAGPQFHLFDAGEHLLLMAEVPGMTDKDIEINANAEGMTLSGKQTSQAPEGFAVQRQERGSISFSRSFTFPCRVDLEKIAATLKEGILEVKIAKAPEAKPRQINITVA